MIKKTTIVFITLALVVLFYRSQSDITPSKTKNSHPDTSHVSFEKTQEKQRIIAENVKLDTMPPTRPEAVKCIPRHEYNNSPLRAAYEQWGFDNFGYGKIDNENYMNESQLLQQAHAGNRYAMFVLGRNYRWHAKMDTFVSNEVRPKELPEQESKEKPFDLATLDKARFWLTKASTNGLLGGLGEISLTYADQYGFLSKERPVNKEKMQTMLLTAAAYSALQGWLSPQVYHLPAYQAPVGLSAKDRLEFDLIFDGLQVQWHKNRLDAGFKTEFKLTIPPEFYQIKQMKICDSL